MYISSVKFLYYLFFTKNMEKSLKRKTVAFQLDEDLHKKLRLMSYLKGKTISGFVQDIIVKELEKLKELDKQIEQISEGIKN